MIFTATVVEQSLMGFDSIVVDPYDGARSVGVQAKSMWHRKMDIVEGERKKPKASDSESILNRLSTRGDSNY